MASFIHNKGGQKTVLLTNNTKILIEKTCQLFIHESIKNVYQMVVYINNIKKPSLSPVMLFCINAS